MCPVYTVVVTSRQTPDHVDVLRQQYDPQLLERTAQAGLGEGGPQVSPGMLARQNRAPLVCNDREEIDPSLDAPAAVFRHVLTP